MAMLFVYLASFLQLVAESFPVSSSGHLALLAQIWHKVTLRNATYAMALPWSDPLFWERYIDMLHVVPLCIIAWYFYPRWRVFLWYPFRTWRLALKLIGYAALADMVTGVLYLSRNWIPFTSIPLWIGFSCTALLLLSLLLMSSQKSVRLTPLRAVLLGFIQGLALLPGLSRFAATFCGARYLGFSSRSAFELSFMLQWPLILAAVSRSTLFFVHYSSGFLTLSLIGVLVFSAVLAWVGFCIAARLVARERLWIFSWYVAVVALVAGIVAY